MKPQSRLIDEDENENEENSCCPCIFRRKKRINL